MENIGSCRSGPYNVTDNYSVRRKNFLVCYTYFTYTYILCQIVVRITAAAAATTPTTTTTTTRATTTTTTTIRFQT
jgi:hypothetical protein